MNNTFIYIVDEVIAQIKQLEINLKLNELDLVQYEFWTTDNKKHIKNLLELLDLLVKTQNDNPTIIKLIKEVTGLEDFLKSIIKAYTNEPSRAISKMPTEVLLSEVNERVEAIIKLLYNWENIIKKKVDVVSNNNKFLRNIPLHRNRRLFYVYVKELNPTTLQTKHPLNIHQAARVAQLSNEKLLNFNKEDYISGRRDFRRGDDFMYPGSQIIITQGHHRIFEIYKRYLEGKINGDEIIEFVIS